MSLVDCPKFSKTMNDYYTQEKMWKNIDHLIPKDKVILEAFLLNSNSNSIKYLTNLGCKKVVGNNKLNFLEDDLPDFDMVVSNPPFENTFKKKILQKLIDIDKPFIIILNTMNVFSKYFRDIFGDKLKYLQIIKPRGKITFEIWDEEDKILKRVKRDPAFYACYLAYRMDIPNEDLWLR